MLQQDIDRLQNEWLRSKFGFHTLNVGCGENPYKEAVNIDPNPDRSDWADFPFDVHDLAFFDPNWFDAIVSNHVIQSLKKPKVAMAEMIRVLKPGGVMAHVIPDQRYTPLKQDPRYPFQWMHNQWTPDTFREEIATHFLDDLAFVEIECFEQFNWSFKVLAVKLEK